MMNGCFDGPLYERMEECQRNSPLYQAANIQSSLLVAFGDNDGVVDWYQGIKMYSTMCHMQKLHIMLVYASENHVLLKRKTRSITRKAKKNSLTFIFWKK